MPNGALKKPEVNPGLRLIPYEKGSLSGQVVESMNHLDPASFPWDAPREEQAASGFSGVKASRSRGVLSFTTMGPAAETVRVYAKRCRVLGISKNIASLFGKCKSEREWELGWALLKRGIPTAMPLLWAERRRLGMVTENYLVSLGIERGVSFLHVWRAQPSVEVRHEWLERLARFIRQAHDKGFAHDDLSTEHVLVVAGYPADTSPPQFYFIDLDHGRIAKRISGYRRAHNFFQIFRSLPSSLLGTEERRVFLSAYSGGKWTVKDMEGVERVIGFIRRMKRIRKALLGGRRR